MVRSKGGLCSAVGSCGLMMMMMISLAMVNSYQFITSSLQVWTAKADTRISLGNKGYE